MKPQHGWGDLQVVRAGIPRISEAALGKEHSVMSQQVVMQGLSAGSVLYHMLVP